MKTFLIIAVAVIFYTSCKTVQFSRSEKRQMKESYVYSFKMTYFKKIATNRLMGKVFQQRV